MTHSQKRRFIAGASCPACKAKDTLFVLSRALNDAVECAACGHWKEAPQNEELEDAEEQAVKFVDVGKN